MPLWAIRTPMLLPQSHLWRWATPSALPAWRPRGLKYRPQCGSCLVRGALDHELQGEAAVGVAAETPMRRASPFAPYKRCNLEPGCLGPRDLAP